MQLKSVLIAALVGMTAVEASTIPMSRGALVSRQNNRFRGGFNRGGNNNNGGDNNNDNNNGGDNNNNGGDNNNNNGGDNNNNNNGGDNNNNDNNNGGDNNAQDASLCLDPAAVQTGSASDGQNGDAADGQVASATDDANFINFCAGKTLTNGLQITEGSCNGIPMVDIPAQNRMVSTIMLNPAHNDDVQANTDFDVTIKVDNLQAGFFTNPQETYYSAPQTLNNNGQVIGHTHVVIQDLGNSLTPQNPLDASQFVFFKGINDDGNGQGTLSATVTGGLPAGNYRVCTMAGASNHQPVLMPVAQRGTQEDCNKFTVSEGGGGNNNNNGNGGNDNNDNGGNDNNNNDNGGNNNNGGGNNNNGGGRGGNNSGSDNDNNNNNGDNNNNDNNQNNGNDNDNGNNNGGGGGNGGASAANALGGIAAPEISDSGSRNRPFSVNGNTFVNKAAAVQRACAIQNNACADAANRGELDGVSVGDCNAQESACAAELS